MAAFADFFPVISGVRSGTSPSLATVILSVGGQQFPPKKPEPGPSNTCLAVRSLVTVKCS
ncbi:hypothetical protein E2C01_050968 [Portunus trituberculatus]|uniref:Uncharacterized protein n=1 Tax=Portunus trituberculatus TaxID=210409 RepID=A0A5B7G9Q5_PORTR|nr:hypothetical protein [Portunus trituberculatus]